VIEARAYLPDNLYTPSGERVPERVAYSEGELWKTRTNRASPPSRIASDFAADLSVLTHWRQSSPTRHCS
jgi:hypothetical protein